MSSHQIDTVSDIQCAEGREIIELIRQPTANMGSYLKHQVGTVRDT